MSFPLNDIGSQIKAVNANFSGDAAAITRAPSLITAGAGLDNLKFLGETIDRKVGNAMANSCNVATQHASTLDTAETLSLAHEIQESDDGSTWDSAEVIEATTVKSTAAAAGNEKGVDEHDLDLMARKRYYRINVTPNLSRANTDVASFATVVNQGGFTQTPQ